MILPNDLEVEMNESFIESDGARLWSVAQGSGVPLVLCHGGPGCCDYLGPVAELFADGVQVIRFEQRGCGRSETRPPYDVETSLRDLESIRRHYGVEQWIVAGHSWGADLSIIYGLHYPGRTLGMICLSGGRMNDDREWHNLYAQRREAGLEPALVFDYPPNMEVNRQLSHSMKRFIQRPTLFRELANLAVPALFVYGSDDIRPSWPVEQVASLLPLGKLAMLAGANHYTWQTHAGPLKDMLNDFISDLSTQAGPHLT